MWNPVKWFRRWRKLRGIEDEISAASTALYLALAANDVKRMARLRHILHQLMDERHRVKLDL